jgi:hypothetical protein
MLLALLFVSLLSNIVGDILYGPHKRDEVPQCTQWASSGECDENPDYMLKSCVDACSTVKRQDPPYNDATSFYDIVVSAVLRSYDISTTKITPLSHSPSMCSSRKLI